MSYKFEKQTLEYTGNGSIESVIAYSEKLNAYNKSVFDFKSQYSGMTIVETHSEFYALENYEVLSAGVVCDMRNNPEYIVTTKGKKESCLFTEARECIEKLSTYKLLYPNRATVYQNAITERYLQLDNDLALLDEEYGG